MEIQGQCQATSCSESLRFEGCHPLLIWQCWLGMGGVLVKEGCLVEENCLSIAFEYLRDNRNFISAKLWHTRYNRCDHYRYLSTDM
jgi:hypothetical protein